MYYIPLLSYRSNHSKPVQYYCILCVFLLLAQNKNHLKTPCNETSPSQWVSSLGLANLSLFFVKQCHFPSMIPSHFVGVIHRLLLLTVSSLSWRLQMTQHLWRDDANPWEDFRWSWLWINIQNWPIFPCIVMITSCNHCFNLLIVSEYMTLLNCIIWFCIAWF